MLIINSNKEIFALTKFKLKETRQGFHKISMTRCRRYDLDISAIQTF